MFGGYPQVGIVGKGWQSHCKTTVSPCLSVFFWLTKDSILFGRVGDMDAPYQWGWTSWSWQTVFTPGQLSVEFVNDGGSLTCGDLAMDSCAQFLAAAEHRLIPSMARSVGQFLRKAGHQSVWAHACQDKVAGGHAGVGVVSVGAAPLALPTFATSDFLEFFKLGRALRVTLRT